MHGFRSRKENCYRGTRSREIIPGIHQRSFQPYQPKHRKPGTGCIYRINDHLWEGKYSPVGPDGKRIRRNVYAKTREECEEKLAVMIEEMKREIEQQKQRTKQQILSESALL